MGPDYGLQSCLPQHRAASLRVRILFRAEGTQSLTSLEKLFVGFDMPVIISIGLVTSLWMTLVEHL